MKKPKSAWVRRGVLLALLLTASAMGLRGLEAPHTAQPRPTPSPAVQDERSLRETAYAQDVAALQALADSENADADTRLHAARQLQALVEAHQCEIAIETALKKAGYEPCMVLMTGDALTVMLDASAVDAQSSEAILALCTAHTELGAENIRIMSR